MKGLWFSRHEMTEDQHLQNKMLGWGILDDSLTKELATRSLEADMDTVEVWTQLLNRIVTLRVDGVFGVFPTPIQELISEDTRRWARMEVDAPERAVRCYAAWNVRRSVEGQKPTFEHYRWCSVGVIVVPRPMPGVYPP